MKLITKYIYHIEYIREKVGISRTALCDEVCSERQYRRYLNGEGFPSYDKIQLFFENFRTRLIEWKAKNINVYQNCII